MQIKFSKFYAFNDSGHMKAAKPGEVLKVKDEALAERIIEAGLGEKVIVKDEDYENFWGHAKPEELPEEPKPEEPAGPYKDPAENLGASPQKSEKSSAPRRSGGRSNKAVFSSPHK